MIPLDTFNLLHEISRHRRRTYGFTNVTHAAPAAPTSSLICSPANYPAGRSRRPTRSPTACTRPRPRTRSSPTTRCRCSKARARSPCCRTRRRWSAASRADRVGAHLAGKPDGRRHALVGRRARRLPALRPTATTTTASARALTVGVDWASGNLVFGGFAGYGQQQTRLGPAAAAASTRTMPPSAASSAGSAAAPGSTARSATASSASTSTAASHLGSATRTHTGSPDGNNLSVGVNAGWDFGDGALRHGPVLGVLAQQIDIDGYAESEPALSTSLAYPGPDVRFADRQRRLAGQLHASTSTSSRTRA